MGALLGKANGLFDTVIGMEVDGVEGAILDDDEYAVGLEQRGGCG